MKTDARTTPQHAEISDDQLDQIAGGMTCLYDDKQYSPGAKIKLNDGTVQTCQKDGTWS